MYVTHQFVIFISLIFCINSDVASVQECKNECGRSNGKDESIKECKRMCMVDAVARSTESCTQHCKDANPGAPKAKCMNKCKRGVEINMMNAVALDDADEKHDEGR